MSPLEAYQAKEADSRAALAAATNPRDRAHHERAVSIYRKLIAGLGEAEARAKVRPERRPRP